MCSSEQHDLIFTSRLWLTCLTNSWWIVFSHRPCTLFLTTGFCGSVSGVMAMTSEGKEFVDRPKSPLWHCRILCVLSVLLIMRLLPASRYGVWATEAAVGDKHIYYQYAFSCLMLEYISEWQTAESVMILEMMLRPFFWSLPVQRWRSLSLVVKLWAIFSSNFLVVQLCLLL